MVVAASCYGDAFHRQGLDNWSGLRARSMEPNTEILEENLFQSARDLGLGRRFTFQ
ncbi:UNVERIFIED_CONTAM: hypothetical protein FKN15_042751 [Acipenser sinensis]